MGEVEGDVNNLHIRGIIGFDGSTISGFLVHPDKAHVIYPLGDKVTIKHWDTNKQYFLAGHTNIISAIDVSSNGKYIASGQINHIGFKAMVIIWDFVKKVMLHKYETHKVRVEAIAFSKDNLYLLSLGGRDCGSVVVWDIQAECPLCGSPASKGIQGEASVICPTNRRGACFVTAGVQNLMVWRIDKNARNVRGVAVNMSKLKRDVLSMDMNERDEYCYCGTTTGDVLKIRMNFHHDTEVLEPVLQPVLVGCFAKLSTKKSPAGKVDLYTQGIRSIMLLANDNLLIGAGDGTVDIVEIDKQAASKKYEKKPGFAMPSIPALRILKHANVKNSVTSLQIWREKDILAGTINCEIFSIDMKTFEVKLIITCHVSTIYSIAFPHNYSDVFATSSKDDVRIWSMETMQELLRIKVQNFSCSCVAFTFDGTAVLTAWNDGIIRAFTPLTGRLIYSILNAHNKGVSALAVTSHGRTIISGGCEGQVRLWDINPIRQSLICTLKEHRAPVTVIDINKDDDEAVSACTDGTCIIWDVIRHCRKQILFANTLFMTVRYYPTSVQILTGGSDHKVAYWETLDGTLVRELEGSASGAINSVDISPDGKLFITGSNDQIFKLWKYQEGITTHIGLGHSAVITAVRFSPDARTLISVSAAGSIFIWDNPFWEPPKEPEPEVEEEVKVTPKEKPKSEETIENIRDSPKVEKGDGDKPLVMCECGCGRYTRDCCCSTRKK